MKCVTQGANIKILAKAIHSLGKIGSDLFVEPNESELILHSINNNKSAFASFSFDRGFFSEYRTEIRGNNDSNYDASCRISLKACLGIFKNMKKVEYCIISMDLEKLIVELHCHLDTKKIYTISILDVDTLQSAHKFDANVSRISGSHKIFGDISNNFQMAEEEITMEFDFDSLTVRNYVEASLVEPTFMRSQLTLKPDEFIAYSVKEKVSITFCLREFRALLNFVENINMELILKFSKAGQPALLTCGISDKFESNLLLSTLGPSDLNQSDNLALENTAITNTHLNLREPFVKQSIEISSFQDSQKIEKPNLPSSSNGNCKRKASTVFTRCFAPSDDNTLANVCHSTILAYNSDTESC